MLHLRRALPVERRLTGHEWRGTVTDDTQRALELLKRTVHALLQEKQMQTTTGTSSNGKAVQTRSAVDATAFKNVLDREKNIDDLVKLTRDEWAYNLEDRRPGPAVLHDGRVKPTDLDLACLLSTLAARKAVVVLPKYMSAAPKKGGKAATNGQTLIDPNNRRGQLIRLSSNQEYFSFSALVVDQNVLDTSNGGSFGAPRYFHIIGKDGRWHPGWDSIQFVADAKENDFIKHYGLAVGSQMAFKQFVAPERWTAFYGHHYLMTKLLITRLEDEAGLLRQRIKGVKALQPKSTGTTTSFEKDEDSVKFPKSKMEVPIFEAEVDADAEFHGVTSFFLGATGHMTERTGLTFSMLSMLEERLKLVQHDYLPDLRFAARVTELAFYKAHGEKAGIPSFALTNAASRWSDQTVKRTTWRAFNIPPTMGSNMTLRYRIRSRTIDVDSRTV